MPDGKRSLTVAIASSMFFPGVGGTEVFLHNLAEKLAERGHVPVVVTSFSRWMKMRSSANRFPYQILPFLPKQYPLSRRFDAFLRVQDRYFSLLQREYEFDVWQSFGTFPAGVGVGHFTDRWNVPHVLRTNGSDIQKDLELGYGMRLKPDIERAIERHATKCDRMIALTRSVVPDCQAIGMDPSRVEVIPCAIDVDRFTGDDIDEHEVRRRHDIPKDEFLFLTVGRNHPKKGFRYLIEAAEILEGRVDTPFRVAIVGKGTEPLEKRVQEQGIAARVSFVDQVGPFVEGELYRLPPKPLIGLYRAADACVFPSLLETFGNVNIEAMAAGLSLISTDAPGSRDVVDHEHTGLLAKAGGPDDLANKMERILDSPNLRRTLATNAREAVQERYSWDEVVGEYERLYLDLCR